MRQLNLRLPDDLHVRLIEAARRDQRSLNKEITWLLEQALLRQATVTPP